MGKKSLIGMGEHQKSCAYVACKNGYVFRIGIDTHQLGALTGVKVVMKKQCPNLSDLFSISKVYNENEERI